MIALKNCGLVLEGGGFRGVYTSGVLRFFMEKDIVFPYVIGVSMGACNAANYVSRQPERNRIVNTAFVHDRRYLSYRRLMKHGELFGMDFIFDTIPHTLVPFDYETFRTSTIRCVTVVTDCKTGNPLYFDKDVLGTDYLTVLMASSSLPFVSKPVNYDGHVLMDGGLADSIPLRRSIADGNDKNVLILTRPREYRKKPSLLAPLARITYARLPGISACLARRHDIYNDTMEYIDNLEDKGGICVIRPDASLPAGRIERSMRKLMTTYNRGYTDAAARYDEMMAYLSSNT